MTKKERAAATLVKRHFERFAKSKVIHGKLTFKIADVLSITRKTNKKELSREFSKHFVFFKLGRNGRPVGLRKLALTKRNASQAIRNASLLFRGAAFFVSIAVRYGGRSESLRAIVKKNAKPGDFRRIIDPLTPSIVGLPQITEKTGSKTRTYKFDCALGPSCEFVVTIDAICGTAGLKTCEGGVEFKNTNGCFLNHGTCERSPIRKENDCCVFTYDLDLEYGLTGVTITYTSGGFTVTGGHFSETIFSKEDDISDCCGSTIRVSQLSGDAAQRLGSCYSDRTCSRLVATGVTPAQCHYDHDGKSWKADGTDKCDMLLL